MPAIGTGQHRFPEELVFKIVREQVENMTISDSSQVCLKDIRVIVFDDKRLQTTQTMDPDTSPSAPVIPVTNEPIVASSRTLCFGLVRVSLHEGDITKHQVEGIINVLPNTLKLSDGGGVCKSIIRAGGRTVQLDIDALGKRLPGSVFLTSAGSMTNAKKILHFLPISTDVQGLQTSIEKCFKKAKLQSLSSVSISAIGTVSFNISPKSSADLILNAAQNFSRDGLSLNINIVVFLKNMVSDFENAIQERAKENTKTLESQVLSSSSVADPSAQTRSSSNQQTELCIGEVSEVVQLYFISGSQSNIDKSIEKVKTFIQRNTATKTISNEKMCEVLQENKSEVEKLARKYDVLIKSSSSGVASIEGMAGDVSDCKDELKRLVDEKCLSQYVQWSYFEGTQAVAYDIELNGSIETAFAEKRTFCHISRNGVQRKIDFPTMTELIEQSGKALKITRKLVRDSNSGIPNKRFIYNQ